MRNFMRILTLALALLMLVGCFAACDGEPAGTTERPSDSTQKESEEDPRKAVKDTVPTNLNLKDDTVTFFTRNDSDIYTYELACEELLNNTVYDAVHYRNIDVENRLNVKIKTIGQPGSWADLKSWTQTLSTAVLTSSGDFDGAAFYLSYGSTLAKEGIYFNLMNLTKDFGGGHLNFEKPWWNQTMVDELSVYNALFFAGGSLTLSEVQNGCCLFFNKDLFNKLFPDKTSDALYASVRAGTWTADEMAEYVAAGWEDVNSNGVIDDGDVVGIRMHAIGQSAGQMDGWVVAMGLDLTEMNVYGEPEISLFNSRTIPAYEKVRNIFGNNPGAFLTVGNVTQTYMQNGNQLFKSDTLKFGSDMRASDVLYGVLPLPKYDAEQEDYRTCFGNGSSCLAICSDLSPERASSVSAVLELLSAESYKQVIPVYYETVLQGQYSRDEADAEMYDRILNSFVFSFGFAYSTQSLDSLGSIFRDMSPTFDIQTHIDSKRISWETKLADLLNALEAVS